MKSLTTPNTPVWTERFNELSQEAKYIYTTIYDYCTYASDPQYQKLHQFRNVIDKKFTGKDRDILIDYFNTDPAIRWNGIPQEPFEYYRKPYYQS
jgi:hypothetical protein